VMYAVADSPAETNVGGERSGTETNRGAPGGEDRNAAGDQGATQTFPAASTANESYM
jgi:hypothetical protein